MEIKVTLEQFEETLEKIITERIKEIRVDIEKLKILSIPSPIPENITIKDIVARNLVPWCSTPSSVRVHVPEWKREGICVKIGKHIIANTPKLQEWVNRRLESQKSHAVGNLKKSARRHGK